MKAITQNTSDLDLIQAMRKAVKYGHPLSVVRCGDGEMHILTSVEDFPKGIPGQL